jgi:membrane associated rhomboid family serine protease
MLFSQKENSPLKRLPVISLIIIGINICVFIYLMFLPQEGKLVFFRYGAVPAAIMYHDVQQPVMPFLCIIFSLFLHSGFLHLLGNMVYFWIFSARLEDKLGHFRFLFFYFFCGFAAVLIYSLWSPHSTRPLVGASGAVSGILGAYLFLFPVAKINPVPFAAGLIKKFKAPAFLVIGLWASVQFYGGLVSLFITGTRNIAWFAHLGGFLIGLSTIQFWIPRHTATADETE